MKNKPNLAAAAATTPMLLSFLVLVVVWSAICSPVIQTHSACCFTEQKYIYCIFTNTTCVIGVMCFIWTIRTGLWDRDEIGFVAKKLALDARLVLVVFERLAKFKKKVSWGISWFPPTMKCQYFSAWGVLIGWLWIRCWTVNVWRYLKNVKMWYIFHTSINWPSFTSPGFHCHV